jgi:hypothetical protein
MTFLLVRGNLSPNLLKCFYCKSVGSILDLSLQISATDNKLNFHRGSLARCNTTLHQYNNEVQQ